MKISELVTELEALWAEHGDLEVVYTNICCCYGDWDADPAPRIRQINGYDPYVNL